MKGSLPTVSLLLAFSGFSACVQINIDTSKAPDLEGFGARVKQEITNWYPSISNYFSSPNYTPPQVININFDPNYKGVAAAYMGGSVGQIVGSVDYYRGHKDDVGSMIHEAVHIVQGYTKPVPGWLTEGIADYYRYYKYEPSKVQRKPGTSNSYTNGYGVTAYFFNYILKTYRYSPDLVYWANKDAREGTYQDTLWPRFTGKTLDQLWSDMMKSG